jgi:acetyl esterase
MSAMLEGADMLDDPELEALRDETAAGNEMVAALLADNPGFHEQTPEEAREGIPGVPEAPILDHGITRSIPGPGGDIPLRIFVPENPKGVYLHIHGGGWVIGSAVSADPKLDAVANASSSVVVSVEYRLAPEHPYPAGPDDCLAAAAWVLENAEAEWGVTDIVIGGESAGGHLAAVTALGIRDQLNSIDRVVGMNLVYGVYDLSMTPSQKAGTELLLIPTDTMAWFYDHFLQGGEDRQDPAVSPLYADLAGLPPALLSVGTKDPLLDDSLFMAARLRAAGNEATLDVYPEAIHGFTVLPGPAGELGNTRANQFIASCWS